MSNLIAPVDTAAYKFIDTFTNVDGEIDGGAADYNTVIATYATNAVTGDFIKTIATGVMSGTINAAGTDVCLIKADSGITNYRFTLTMSTTSDKSVFFFRSNNTSAVASNATGFNSMFIHILENGLGGLAWTVGHILDGASSVKYFTDSNIGAAWTTNVDIEVRLRYIPSTGVITLWVDDTEASYTQSAAEKAITDGFAGGTIGVQTKDTTNIGWKKLRCW